MLRTTLFCLGVLLLGTSADLLAQLPIFDDFEDGSVFDGSPVLWSPSGGGTRRVSDDGDFIMSGSGLASSWIWGTGDVRDVSVRTRLRLLDGSPAGSLFARSPATDPTIWGAIYGTGTIELGQGFSHKVVEQTNISPYVNDVFLQLDAFGDETYLTVWEEGSEKPTEPQLRLHDDTMEPGPIGLLMNGLGNNGSVAFRWFQAVASDFDCNGTPSCDSGRRGCRERIIRSRARLVGIIADCHFAGILSLFTCACGQSDQGR